MDCRFTTTKPFQPNSISTAPAATTTSDERVERFINKILSAAYGSKITTFQISELRKNDEQVYKTAREIIFKINYYGTSLIYDKKFSVVLFSPEERLTNMEFGLIQNNNAMEIYSINKWWTPNLPYESSHFLLDRIPNLRFDDFYVFK